MTAPRIVDVAAANRFDDAAAIVFEYVAMTQVEVGGPWPDSPDELPPSLRDECLNLVARYRRPGALFLALQGNAAIGCVGVAPWPQAGPGIVEVKRLYVRAPHRGRGVATALMRAAHEHALAEGFRRVVLTAMTERTGAVAFYESIGYRVVAPLFPLGYEMVWLSRSL